MAAAPLIRPLPYREEEQSELEPARSGLWSEGVVSTDRGEPSLRAAPLHFAVGECCIKQSLENARDALKFRYGKRPRHRRRDHD